MWMLLVAFLALATGQPAGQYSGRWTAQFHGTTYVRLVLSESDGAPQGRMSIGDDIHVNVQGEVDGASDASSTLTRMQNLHWNGKVLSFSIQEGDDTHRFEFRLIDANTGELTPVIPPDQRQELVDAGIPVPKPFRVTRAQ